MNAINMPGFTAGALLHKSVVENPYTTLLVNIASNNRIEPQLPPLPPPGTGCGPCTPLTWPNGGSTGACAMDCIDALGATTSEPAHVGAAVSSGVAAAVFSGTSDDGAAIPVSEGRRVAAPKPRSRRAPSIKTL
jgi:hypothetical protein